MTPEDQTPADIAKQLHGTLTRGLSPIETLRTIRLFEARLTEAIRAERDSRVAEYAEVLGDTPAKPRAKREPKVDGAVAISLAEHDRKVLHTLGLEAATGKQPMTVGEIAESSGVTEHYVRQALERLVPGKVTREKAATGRGWRYSLAKSEAAQ